MDAYFTAQYGSYNELKLEGAVGGPLTEKISTRLSANYTRSDGFIKNGSGADLNANDSLSVRAQVLLKPTEDFSFLISARTWQFFKSPGAATAPTPFVQDASGVIRKPSSAAEYASFCAGINPFAPPPAGAWQSGNCFTAQPDPFRGNFGPDVNFKEDYKAITGTAEWNLSDAIKLTSISDYQDMSMKFINDLDNTPARIGEYIVNIKKSKQFSQELRLNGALNNLDWVTGLYYLDIDHDIANNVNLFDHPGYGISLPVNYTQKTKSYAAFGQVDWKFTPEWTLSVGARVLHDKKSINNVSTCISNPVAPPGLCDFLGSVVFPGALAFNRTYVGKLSQTNWSGRAAIKYQPNSDLMLYASVTRGVKGAGFNSGTVEFYPLAAVPYGKEVLTSYETGVKASMLDRRLTIDGSVFYYDYQDYQTYSPSTTGGLRVFNIDARIIGAELSVTARPTDGLTLTAAGTYLDTKQKDVPLPNGTFRDFQIPDAPKFSLIGEIRYELPLTGDDMLAFQLNGTYVGQRSIALIGEKWEFAVFANNFTDEVIRQTRLDFTTVTGGTVDSLERPRWFGGSVTYRY